MPKLTKLGEQSWVSHSRSVHRSQTLKLTVACFFAGPLMERPPGRSTDLAEAAQKLVLLCFNFISRKIIHVSNNFFYLFTYLYSALVYQIGQSSH